jgi:Uma2 family endonuclease
MPLAAPVVETDLYAELEALPEGQVGEIIAGRLYAQPRPAAPHALAGSSLGADIHGAFQRGRGGPGGWWIIDEPELHFVRDTEVLVPDIAGWQRERMPRMPKDHRFEVVPDWVCEILSPSTARKDRILKMPVYARFAVAYLWLLDPVARTLETFALDNGRWVVTGQFKDEDIVTVPPFEALKLELASLWEPLAGEPGDEGGTGA